MAVGGSYLRGTRHAPPSTPAITLAAAGTIVATPVVPTTIVAKAIVSVAPWSLTLVASAVPATPGIFLRGKTTGCSPRPARQPRTAITAAVSVIVLHGK